MRTPGYMTLLFLCLLICPLISPAQPDPEKICRIEEGRLVFTLDLKWSEKEIKSVRMLFDLDSLLMLRVYKGEKQIIAGNETWNVVVKTPGIVELSKPLHPETGKETGEANLFMVIDNWMNFGGDAEESPVEYGVNKLDIPNVFVYTGKIAQFYLPGFPRAGKVYISGTFNNWSTTRNPMKFMGKGWMADLKLEPGKYTYKYIVDGVWTTDPSNRLRERGGAGSNNSVIYCYNHIFTLKGFKNARSVVVTGNFFNWNPKGIPMFPSVDGWALPMFLRDGTYAYKFLVDNKWMTDPDNPSERKDANGNTNSFLEIGEPFLFRLDGFTEAQKVILTGSFNHWDESELVMDKSTTGWQLRYVVPPGNYEYKFITDGKWMTDPANPFSTGSGDYVNSFIALKANHLFELKQHQDAREVVVTGSFSGWTPNGYRMVRQNGKWILPFFLKPGKYTYKFIVDGNWITDPGNPLYEENEYGTGNSVLWIDPS